MLDKQLKGYSISDYVVFENESENKHEYEDGIVTAMSGGTLNHGIIANNINAEIYSSLKSSKKPCTSINGDVRIFVEQANSFVYPDGIVVCGTIETFKDDPHSIINPTLIIEVLSKSTESYDRGTKFHKYCSLSSFQEYILIDQYKPVIDSLFRAKKGEWKMVTTIGLDQSIYLHSIDATILLKDIYRNTVDLKKPQFRLDL